MDSTYLGYLSTVPNVYNKVIRIRVRIRISCGGCLSKIATSRSLVRRSDDLTTQ